MAATIRWENSKWKLKMKTRAGFIAQSVEVKHEQKYMKIRRCSTSHCTAQNIKPKPRSISHNWKWQKANEPDVERRACFPVKSHHRVSRLFSFRRTTQTFPTSYCWLHLPSGRKEKSRCWAVISHAQIWIPRRLWFSEPPILCFRRLIGGSRLDCRPLP